MVKVPKMFRSLSEEEKEEKELKARIAKVKAKIKAQKKKDGLRLKGGGEDFDVFISLRFSEAETEAKMLQSGRCCLYLYFICAKERRSNRPV